MSHAISFLKQYPVAFLSMNGDAPWHDLYTRNEKPCETLLDGLIQTKEEITTTSGLSMKQQAQVMEANFNGDNIRLVTGVVGKGYTVQDFDVIRRRIQRLQEAGITQEFAAALDNFGELMFTFKVGSFSIFGKDQHNAYMTMVARYNYQGHDEFFASIVRAICKNTQRFARVDAQERNSYAKFRHSKNINELAEQATMRIVGLDSELGAAYKNVVDEMNEAEAFFTRLAETRSNSTLEMEFVKAMCGDASTRAKNEQDRLHDCIAAESDDSLYSLFNGLTLFSKGTDVRLRDAENQPQGAQMAARVGADLFDKGQTLRQNAENWLQQALLTA